MTTTLQREEAPARVSDERLAEMLESARRLELAEWVSAWTELIDLRKSLRATREASGDWVMVPREPTAEMLAAGSRHRPYVEDDGDYDGDLYRANTEGTYAAMLAAAPALPAGIVSGRVEVSPLEWREEQRHWKTASAPFGGAYTITEYAGSEKPFKLDATPFLFKTSYHDSAEQAKAAAQADYDQRIFSCLEPTRANSAQVASTLSHPSERGDGVEPVADDLLDRMRYCVNNPSAWRSGFDQTISDLLWEAHEVIHHRQLAPLTSGQGG